MPALITPPPPTTSEDWDFESGVHWPGCKYSCSCDTCHIWWGRCECHQFWPSGGRRWTPSWTWLSAPSFRHLPSPSNWRKVFIYAFKMVVTLWEVNSLLSLSTLAIPGDGGGVLIILVHIRWVEVLRVRKSMASNKQLLYTSLFPTVTGRTIFLAFYKLI